MNSDPKLFGIVIEHKCEKPIVMEGPLLTVNEAHARMRAMTARADIIRAAVFKAEYADGNESLIPKEE